MRYQKYLNYYYYFASFKYYLFNYKASHKFPVIRSGKDINLLCTFYDESTYIPQQVSPGYAPLPVAYYASLLHLRFYLIITTAFYKYLIISDGSRTICLN